MLYQKLTIPGIADRWYNAYVPSGCKNPAPIIVALHGGGGTPGGMATMCGMNSLADKYGFIVVYPAGQLGPSGSHSVLLCWNDGRVGMTAPLDDVAFIAAMLDDADAKLAYLKTGVVHDPAKIFATGISNGALMCWRLAAELPEYISGIAPVAGQKSTSEVSELNLSPLPIISFHGLKDTFIPYNGGKGNSISDLQAPNYTYPAVSNTLQMWARFNSCSFDLTAPSSQIGQAQKFICTNGTMIHWKLLDGGHTWPGGVSNIVDQLAGVGKVNKDISASAEMVKFFLR